VYGCARSLHGLTAGTPRLWEGSGRQICVSCKLDARLRSQWGARFRGSSRMIGDGESKA